MRLWSLHPKYLDARGLVALWREALLAQAVLRGRTRGYTRHPQLIRFRGAPSPVAAVAAYLDAVFSEAVRRGYHFDKSKIAGRGPAAPMPVTRGQLAYEWAHLKAKLAVRAPAWLAGLGRVGRPDPHPLFHPAAGPVADWEAAPRREAGRPVRRGPWNRPTGRAG